MSELTKDIKVGRKSETEKRMQENWGEIKERRIRDVEKRREAARGKKNAANGEEREPEEAAVPKQIIVNGVIVVANESREVAFGAGLEQAAREQADVAIEDDRIYKYVNQATLGKNAGRDKRGKWDEDTTNLFYQGLRMFGTDFSMIANLFPESVDRGVIKRKYLAELQIDPGRVDKCVTAKETVSLDEYAALTNMEFEDPDKLMKELEEEEKRLRAEDEKRRADQGYVMTNDGADVPLPSTETDDAGAQTAVDDEEQDADTAISGPAQRTQGSRTAGGDSITALAEKVVQAAVVPKKKQQRRTRESTGAGRGGRGGRRGKRAVEGIEERIGPLDDVEH
jgi:transcription factor TFIIIB component B''